jgi:hypothetical protein
LEKKPTDCLLFIHKENIMRNIHSIIILMSLLVVSSCKKDPVIPNEEELITTMIYTLTPIGGGDIIEFSFRDLDGDGGNDPVIITPPLNSGVVYLGEIQLLNESESPAVNISDEVLSEAEDHQFFFVPDQADIEVTYNDMDGNGQPIGLLSTLTAGSVSDGHLTIILRHLPDKFAMGVSDGDIANAGGETDVEVSFPVLVK